MINLLICTGNLVIGQPSLLHPSYCWQHWSRDGLGSIASLSANRSVLTWFNSCSNHTIQRNDRKSWYPTVKWKDTYFFRAVLFLIRGTYHQCCHFLIRASVGWTGAAVWHLQQNKTHFRFYYKIKHSDYEIIIDVFNLPEEQLSSAT